MVMASCVRGSMVQAGLTRRPVWSVNFVIGRSGPQRHCTRQFSLVRGKCPDYLVCHPHPRGSHSDPREAVVNLLKALFPFLFAAKLWPYLPRDLDPDIFSYSRDFKYAAGKHIQQLTNKTERPLEVYVEMYPDHNQRVEPWAGLPTVTDG
jgi:hypothetical protein